MILQSAKKIHPYDFILERRLLADPSDELKLSRLLSESFKGDSKPLEEEMQFGNQSLLGTLHWRIRASTGGHLAQNMEGTDKNVQNRSFAWAFPLISVWLPPLMMGPDASDNVLWEFKLRDRTSGHKALKALVDQIEDNCYVGAFFAKVMYQLANQIPAH